ncbi:hypothetical protein HDU76_000863 [Blyttiomyces sp. JEL0837]|nr:hypothetical protein HDU76_000863 [Blyttiomyces sp. JEL0837]
MDPEDDQTLIISRDHSRESSQQLPPAYTAKYLDHDRWGKGKGRSFSEAVNDYRRNRAASENVEGVSSRRVFLLIPEPSSNSISNTHDPENTEAGFHGQSHASNLPNLELSNRNVDALKTNLEGAVKGITAFEFVIRSLPHEVPGEKGHHITNVRIPLLYLIRCINDMITTSWYLVRQKELDLEWLVPNDHPLRLADAFAGWKNEREAFEDWKKNGNQGFKSMQKFSCKHWTGTTE